MYNAYTNCIRHKNSTSAKEFETYALYNIKKLTDEINNRKYKLKQAKCFVVKKPRYREVFCCSFRDRVVQQFVYDELYPVIDKTLIFDSSHSRKKKGTDFAIKRVARFLRTSTKNYTEETCR